MENCQRCNLIMKFSNLSSNKKIRISLAIHKTSAWQSLKKGQNEKKIVVGIRLK